VHAGTDDECLPEVIDELMTTAPEAEIVSIIYEKDGGANEAPAGVCAIVSSDRHADALGLVRDLRPEGHRRLARICFLEENIQSAEKAVLNSIRKALGKAKQPEFVGRNALAKASTEQKSEVVSGNVNVAQLKANKKKKPARIYANDRRRHRKPHQQ
jgi:hypothetical protein